MKRILQPLFQGYADSLISRLEKTDTQAEFEALFSQALYLDWIAYTFDVELK